MARKLNYSLYLNRIDYTVRPNEEGKIRSIGSDFEISFTIGAKPSAQTITLNKKISFKKKGRDFKKPILLVKEVDITNKKRFNLPINIGVTELDTSKDYHDYGAKGAKYDFPMRASEYGVIHNVVVVGDKIGDKGRIADLTFFMTLLVEGPPIKIREPHELAVPREILDNKDHSPIIAVVSDVHIGDGSARDDFRAHDDACFIQMLDWLEKVINETKPKEFQLILLGDVLELWEAKADIVSKGKVTDHFKESDSLAQKIKVAKYKVSRVYHFHKKLFERLRAFSEKHDVYYVWGNHDDDFLDIDIRKHFLKLSKIKIKHFSGNHQFKDFNIHAEHGHVFDDFNYAKRFGDIPSGRLTVENISSYLEGIEFFNRVLSLGQDRYVARHPFNAFDSVDDYLKFLNCLVDQKIIASEDEVVKEISKRLLPVIEDYKGDFLADLLKLNQAFWWMNPLEKIRNVLEKLKKERKDHPLLSDAKSRLKGNVQCVMMGHNHKPEIKPLGADLLYVNTGNWQDSLIVKRNATTGECTTPQDHRHLTLVHKMKKDFRKDEETIRCGQYIFPDAKHFDEGFYNLKKKKEKKKKK